MKITTDYLKNMQSAGNKIPVIVAFGGGINSTAMLIGMHRLGVRPDLILFADTGGELPETYEHSRRFSEWLVAHKFPGIIFVSKTFAKQPTTLEKDCIRNETLPSIAFGFKSCSLKYKREPQDKYCNHWQLAKEAWGHDQKCVKVIGYDAGEERRAAMIEDAKYIYWYPLIEWRLQREQCLLLCKSEGFSPPKSACFFCPNAKKAEILSLQQQHPDLLCRALRLESNARLTTIKGLGRQFAWRDFINANLQQQKLIDDYSHSMPCECYDGT